MVIYRLPPVKRICKLCKQTMLVPRSAMKRKTCEECQTDKRPDRICPHCGEVIPRTAGRLYCKCPGGRKDYLIAKKGGVSARPFGKNSVSVSVSNLDTPKVKQWPCRKCGTLSPNRFFCPSCHARLSSNMEEW